MIELNCAHCFKRIGVPDKIPKKPIKCPYCLETLAITRLDARRRRPWTVSRCCCCAGMAAAATALAVGAWWLLAP